MSNTIESLEIEIIGSSQSAEQALDALEGSLSRLKTAVRGGCGLTAVTNQLTAMNKALGSMKPSNIANLNALADGLQTLSSVGNFKLSSSLANQITNLGTATAALNGVDFKKLTDLAHSLTPLTLVGKMNLGSTISQLGKLPAVLQPLLAVDMFGLSQKIRDLVDALKPLFEMGKSNLSSTLNQIKKLPEAFEALNSLDITSFAKKIKEVADALKPLADEMQKVANGFSAFPDKIQKLLNATKQIPEANSKAGSSYVNLAAKIGMAYTAVKRIARVIASWINESNEYVESLNLFTVAMGGYASEAQKYAETVGELMGIDPGEWMRNQGVFMTLATGFGVANDRAYTMSKNLTQLGYDLSSFYNITVEDAMQKLQSGISGELEPLRRLGYDLSQARLKAVALSLGIDKAVSSMTQAEKAELRYYAIMTQVTTAQGDMARTLNAPANQLRVLKAQVTQAARALGNIFIPALNAVLPYLIAVAKVVQYLASAIANLFGFTLPDVDYSGVGDLSSGAEDASGAIDEATDSAKELQKILLGIDELNVMPDASGSGSTDIGGGGGFDFELPEYDFIGDLTESRVAQIVEEMKEWLGLTGDIDSWSDLLDTRLGHILQLVGSIGTGIALWKVTKGFMDSIAALNALLQNPTQTIALGLILTLTGLSIEFSGLSDAIKNGLDGFNFAETVLGGLLTTSGLAVLGKGIATWITSAFADSAIATALSTAARNLGLGSAAAAGTALGTGIGAIIAGIPAFFVGIYDAIVSGIDWLNAILITGGATATGAGIGAIIGSVGGPIGTGTGALIGLIVGLITDGVILIVQNWDSICEWFKEAIDNTTQFFSDLTTLWEENGGYITEGLFDGMSNPFDDITGWLRDNIFDPLIEGFCSLFGIHSPSTVMAEQGGFLAEGVLNGFAEGWKVFSSFLTEGLNSIKSELTEAWKNCRAETSKKWSDITGSFSGKLSEMKTAAYQKFNGIRNTCSEILSNMGFDMDSATEGITGKAIAGFDVMKQGVSDIFSNMWTDIKGWVNSIIAVINSLITGVASGINTIIRALNKLSFTIPEWLKHVPGASVFAGKKFGFSIGEVSAPQIPYLADGGVVRAGQVFVARESGAELVANMGNKTAVMNNDQIVEAVSQGVYRAVTVAMREGGSKQSMVAKVNKKVLFETVVAMAREETMRTGSNPLMTLM